MKRTRKRNRKGPKKGSSFERAICKQLSLWWTHNERDDVFARTSASGAWAKLRARSKKSTFGQYGDVQAIDPIGQPLIDLLMIEIKRGYSKRTLSDLIDRTATKPCMYSKFIRKCVQDSHMKGGTNAWMLVVKRDYKSAVLFIPYWFHRLLQTNTEQPSGTFVLRDKSLNEGLRVLIRPLKSFLQEISPEQVKRLHRTYKRKRR